MLSLGLGPSLVLWGVWGERPWSPRPSATCSFPSGDSLSSVLDFNSALLRAPPTPSQSRLGEAGGLGLAQLWFFYVCFEL